MGLESERAVSIEIEWLRPRLLLLARQVSATTVKAHAARLAAWYNDPSNQRMLGNTETMDEQGVVEHVAELIRAGGVPFLLLCNGEVVGDADLRKVERDEAEFAVMVGDHARQGRGLGTSFSIMLHAYAFETLKLRNMFLSIHPQNAAARRCYDKLGYRLDTSTAARAHLDQPTDVAMSLKREDFQRLHGHAMGRIEMGQAATSAP
jgi:RimJ/RimL family protein N-acetyltransferase